MRIHQGMQPGEFELLEHASVVGTIRGAVVAFLGFRTRDAAAKAAEVAVAALSRHRTLALAAGRESSSGLMWLGDARTLVLRRHGTAVAEVVPAPPPGSALPPGVPAWRVDVRIGDGPVPELFALSQARVMWRAIQGHGLWRRMWQFDDLGETDLVARRIS